MGFVDVDVACGAGDEDCGGFSGWVEGGLELGGGAGGEGQVGSGDWGETGGDDGYGVRAVGGEAREGEAALGVCVGVAVEVSEIVGGEDLGVGDGGVGGVVDCALEGGGVGGLGVGAEGYGQAGEQHGPQGRRSLHCAALRSR